MVRYYSLRQRFSSTFWKTVQALRWTTIRSVPDELLVEIFDWCRLDDEYSWNHRRRWFNLLQVCRRWKDVIPRIAIPLEPAFPMQLCESYHHDALIFNTTTSRHQSQLQGWVLFVAPCQLMLKCNLSLSITHLPVFSWALQLGSNGSTIRCGAIFLIAVIQACWATHGPSRVRDEIG
jgi:F-box-like